MSLCLSEGQEVWFDCQTDATVKFRWFIAEVKKMLNRHGFVIIAAVVDKA